MVTNRYPYELRVAPGCHGSVIAPLVSRHRTLRAAVQAARRSDRVRVEPASSSVCLYQATSRQPTQWGYGLYGGREIRSLRECLKEAEETEKVLASGKKG